MYSSALRHIMCQPITMQDIETWVQGWDGTNSAYQSWYAFNSMPPRIISQMFQQATRTAINSNAVTQLLLEWYMKKCETMLQVANNSYSRTRVTCFVCYPRRDIAQEVYDVADSKAAAEIIATGALTKGQTTPYNCLNQVSVPSAITSSAEPTDTSSNNCWVAGTSPFNSGCFTRMFKVVKVKHFLMEPGQEIRIPVKIKQRVMSMGRYLSYAAATINAGAQQYALEDYYQALKGFPVLFFRAYGSLTNDVSVARSNEFTTQVAADVGTITHQLTVKAHRTVEFYAPFSSPTRTAFITSGSIQSGQGAGLDSTITQAHQALIYPTLTENTGNIE